MRRSTLALALTLIAATTAACGSPGKPSTAMSAAAEPNMSEPGSPNAGSSAAASTSEAAGDDQGSMAPAATAMEDNNGNDGPMAKIPQGRLGKKAVAAGLGKDGVPVITVTGTETTCTANAMTVSAGKVWFKLVNHGMKVNELYLETTKGDELIEVEKVTAGAFGAFKAKVKQGRYLIACEPGMADRQIRVPLTVTSSM